MKIDLVTVQNRTQPWAERETELQRVREQERAHLARELHDELGAILTAAKLDVACLRSRLGGERPEIAQRLEHLFSTLNRGMMLKTSIVEGLAPSLLEDSGLAASLEDLASDFAFTSDVAVSTRLEDVLIGDPGRLVAYRLVQECLTNIAKYACATQAQVLLVDCGQDTMVSVSDNGVGFDASQLSSSRHGLSGMRERVELCGGTLTVSSSPDKGARIVAMLPKQAPAPGASAAS